jgi:hypothetical protein
MIPFKFSILDVYVLVFSELKMRIIRNGALVVYPSGHPNEGDIVEITSPFAYSDLSEVRFAQREDVLYLTHPSYDERVLTRTDHHLWTFTTATYVPVIVAPANLAGAYDGAGNYDVDYIVAAVSEKGEESLASTLVTVSADTSNNWDLGKRVELTWDVVADAEIYVVYKNSRGYYGFIGSTEDLTFRDDNISPDIADGPKVSREPFDGVDNRPGAVGIFQQRKVYGRTNNAPQTTFLTKLGTMFNMSISRPLKADDAITAPLDSNELNEIMHFVPLRDLLVLTASNVWTLGPGANADSMSPTDIRYEYQFEGGSSSLRPITIGRTVLMVPFFQKGVRELVFQIQASGIDGTDLGILANHLFEDDKIIDWAFQEDLSIVWCVMESGKLNSLTFLRAHDVVAWTTHDTQGTFESVAVSRDADRSLPYFTVKRNINGVDVRFIEELTERLPGQVLEDAVYMDCSLSYDGIPATVFSNLDHLEGETVVVLADGNVIEGLVVVSGAITLDHTASKVHIGLGYTSDFETLDVNMVGQEGTEFGDKKLISSATLSMENTRGIKVGPDDTRLNEMPFRTDEGYDEHTRMFTGKKQIEFNPQWGTQGRIHVRQSFPLPVTILATIPEVFAGDDE